MNHSIGALEFRSISKGIEVSNEVVKKANVEIIYMRTICPGKFIVIISGNEGEVNEAIDYGVLLSDKSLIDSFKVHAVNLSIIDAFKNQYGDRTVNGAVGIMETNKVCAGIKALDMSLKSSDVKLIKLHLAFGIGGKLVYFISGSLSNVEYGISEGIRTLDANDTANVSIIRSPSDELLKHLFKYT